MPNWCDNYAIFVHPDPDLVADVADECNVTPSVDGREPRPFNIIHPNPFEPETEDHYDWALDNWGVKWEPAILRVEYEPQYNPNKVKVTFATPWGPPIELYEYMESDEWVVEAMYHEPGQQYVGHFKESQDTYYEYDFSKGEKFREEIPEELVIYAKLENEYEEYKKGMAQIKVDGIEEDLEDLEDENDA